MAKAKTLRELKVAIAQKMGTKTSEAARGFDVIHDAIIKELRDCGEFNLFGLGKLKIVRTKERKGINPQTHKPMIIKPKTKIKFRASKDLKQKFLKK